MTLVSCEGVKTIGLGGRGDEKNLSTMGDVTATPSVYVPKGDQVCSGEAEQVSRFWSTRLTLNITS